MTAATPRLRAQSSIDVSGAPILRLPIGARLIGLGGAGAADSSGPNALFVNPAAFARMVRPEAALEYGQDVASNRLVASFSFPSRVLGTFSGSAYLSDEGSQDVTGETPDQIVGRVDIREVQYAASYAVDFASRFVAGVSYKYVQYRFDCTGVCTDPLAHTQPATGAIDVGAQYGFGRHQAVHLGAVIRNLGPRLQLKDRAQADPLPSEWIVGAAWDVPNVERYVPEASLRVVADAAGGLGVPLENTLHIGAEAVYRHAIMLRAGYAKREGYGGPALGFGFASSRFTIDVARQLTGNALLADKPPTYAGLHYRF